MPGCGIYILCQRGDVAGPVLSGGTAMVFGDGENPVNFVSVDYVAEFVIRGIDGPATGETLTQAGPENFTLNQVVDLFATEAHVQPKVRKMPVGVMRTMSRRWPRSTPDSAGRWMEAPGWRRPISASIWHRCLSVIPSRSSSYRTLPRSLWRT